MLLGVDYYPEQWNIDLMEQDMDTIVEMGCNVIRIAEFSWHMMEKREGQFDFSFFDKLVFCISLFNCIGFSDVGLSGVGFSNIGLSAVGFSNTGQSNAGERD